MTLSPRKSEIEAALAVLESDQYETAEQMAKALVATVGTEVAKRDGYFVTAGDAPFCYGPYWTESAARKAWETIGSAFARPGRIVHTFSWEGRGKS